MEAKQFLDKHIATLVGIITLYLSTSFFVAGWVFYQKFLKGWGIAPEQYPLSFQDTLVQGGFVFFHFFESGVYGWVGILFSLWFLSWTFNQVLKKKKSAKKNSKALQPEKKGFFEKKITSLILNAVGLGRFDTWLNRTPPTPLEQANRPKTFLFWWSILPLMVPLLLAFPFLTAEGVADKQLQKDQRLLTQNLFREEQSNSYFQNGGFTRITLKNAGKIIEGRRIIASKDQISLAILEEGEISVQTFSLSNVEQTQSFQRGNSKDSAL